MNGRSVNGMEECPVCTLYLKPGITLKQHLNTHPKEAVIDALLKDLQAKASEHGSSDTGLDNYSSGTLPPCPPNPQMTTAVTYQQILTTNGAGAVVPQFLQIPTLVNSSFPFPQNMGITPAFLNQMYYPYLQPPYSMEMAPPPSGAPPLHEERKPNVPENDDMDIEMDMSDDAQSCLSRSVSPSPIISEHPPTECDTPTSPPALKPKPTSQRTRSVSSQSSYELVKSLPCTPPPPRLIRKHVEYEESHSLNNSLDEVDSSVKYEVSYVEEAFEEREACMDQVEEEVLDEEEVDEPGCQTEETYQSPVNLVQHKNNDETGEYCAPSENSSSFENYERNEKIGIVELIHKDERYSLPYPERSMTPYSETGDGDRVFTELQPPSSPKVIHDLLPVTNPRRLHDLLPAASSSKTYLEVEHLRMYFNTSPPSTVCDNAKPDVMSPTPLTADESMPARGELSEQESLGADSAWSMFQQDVKLDSWQLDRKPFRCSSCALCFASPKERRLHKLQVHTKVGKTFKCTMCGDVFNTLRERRAHVAQHIDIKSVKIENAVSVIASTADSASTLASVAAAGLLPMTRNCPTCAKPFFTIKELRAHQRDVHNDVRFKCDTCEQGFDSEMDYNAHLKEHPLKCTDCNKEFYRRANLILHMKRHLPVKPFDCSLCPKTFITRQKLDEHMNGHTGVRPIKCLQCEKTFSRHSNLIQHRNMYHPKTKRKTTTRDFVCRCGDVFQSQRKLEWHREIHENKPKSCPYCAQKFIHAASVTRHVRRSHLPSYLPESETRENENVSCPICDRVYLRSSLSVHMRIHNNHRPFSCPVCSKMFTTKWNMELHQWTHQSRSSMPYKCGLCKSAFFRHLDYMSHLNAHKNLKPFICNICGQKFIRKYNCLRHQEEHNKSKQFPCEVTGCGRVFHRSYYLKDHMKVHSGERPHTCHICGKSSSTKSNHNKHVRIHDTRELVNAEN